VEPPLAGRLSRSRWVTRRVITSMQKLQYLDALRLVGQGSQRLLRAPQKPHKSATRRLVLTETPRTKRHNPPDCSPVPPAGSSPAWRVAGAGLTPDPGRRPNCGSPGSARQPAAAVGCRVSRALGGLGRTGHQSCPREWTAARQMGPGDTPGCLVGCPACSRAAPTRRSGLQAMFLWRGREGSLGVGCSRIARGRQGAAASR
jgi:hypothetical protein